MNHLCRTVFVLLLVITCAAGAADSGESEYRVDQSESMVRILVLRGGPLGRLGHDHAVISRQIRGFARLLAGGAVQAELSLAVAELVVDDPQARAAAGLDSKPTAKDIAGTTRNMLVSLDAGRYPDVRLHVTAPTFDSSATAVDLVAAVELTLHGTTRSLTAPIHVAVADNSLRVTGTFLVRQTDFGITPFRVFGGIISVRDELELTFDIGFIER